MIKTQMKGGTWRATALSLAAMVLCGFGPAHAAQPLKSIAFLGVTFTNDKSDLEVRSEDEENRGQKVAELFERMVSEAQLFTIRALPPDLKTKIAAGQPVGECGGCEIDFGRTLQADTVAWATVEKVSNLILFMNVYLKDVTTGQIIFFRSVNIRSNTDESWLRAISYVLKNYLVPDRQKHS